MWFRGLLGNLLGIFFIFWIISVIGISIFEDFGHKSIRGKIVRVVGFIASMIALAIVIMMII